MLLNWLLLSLLLVNDLQIRISSGQLRDIITSHLAALITIFLFLVLIRLVLSTIIIVVCSWQSVNDSLLCELRQFSFSRRQFSFAVQTGTLNHIDRF